ncbi:MAG: hypothetical protein AAF636_03720 [Pseudomonadota bacterium]
MAETCDEMYRVLPNESLSLIAQKRLGDGGRWPEIQALNPLQLGDDPDRLLAGNRLLLPCRPEVDHSELRPRLRPVSAARPATVATSPDIKNPPPKSAPAHTVKENPKIALRIVTGGTVPPFSAPGLPSGGLLPQVIKSALSQESDAHDISWELRGDPLSTLSTFRSDKGIEMALPVTAAACEATIEEGPCDGLLMSDPLFELLLLVYVDADHPVMPSSADLNDAQLCTSGELSKGIPFPTSALVEQAGSLETCFDSLNAGLVDGVIADEFSAERALAGAGLRHKIVGLRDTPLSVTTLHAAIRTDAPGAHALHLQLNAGLARLKRDGAFQQIVARHLAAHWAAL